VHAWQLLAQEPLEGVVVAGLGGADQGVVVGLDDGRG